MAMMPRTTYQHDRVTELEIDGQPVPIASAELTRVSTLDDDDEVIHLEWDVSGKTQAEIHDGVHSLAFVVRGRRLSQRGVCRESHAAGWTVFKIVGLDELKPLA
jgi:hypothetical protein